MTQFVSPFTVELALRTFESLGTPRSLTAAIMVRYGEWDTLTSLECLPRNYLDAESYAKDAAATSLLRKCADLPTTHDRAGSAREKFWSGERDCFAANERLSPLFPENKLWERTSAEIACSDFFERVRKRTFGWLGRGPRHLTDGRFGPGATYSDRGKLTTAADKMSSRTSLTRDAMWYLPQWLGTAWGRACASASRSPVFVKGNRFATVPKDARTDRGICSEPSLNVFYQLGLGAELRRHLRVNAKIDLDYGQEVHRQVAYDSSINLSLATLDLSNASDSVSYNLVKLCLPHGWFEALSDLRSPMTFIEGRWVKLEKFSSMGNGYTFELETIIFLALACEALASCGLPSVPGKDVYVFGDDIIVPRDGVKAVIAVLKFSGLKLNDSKSFFDEGPFRESCGGDYFAGRPVRPHYIKLDPSGPEDLISIANGLYRMGTNIARCNDRLTTGLNKSSILTQLSPEGPGILTRAWFYVLDHLPSDVRSCRGPSDLGDIVIHDASEKRWNIKWKGGIRYVRCYRPIKHRKVSYGLFHPDIVLACATYGLGWNNGGIIPRDAVLGYGCGWVARS